MDNGLFRRFHGYVIISEVVFPYSPDFPYFPVAEIGWFSFFAGIMIASAWNIVNVSLFGIALHIQCYEPWRFWFFLIQKKLWDEQHVQWYGSDYSFLGLSFRLKSEFWLIPTDSRFSIISIRCGSKMRFLGKAYFLIMVNDVPNIVLWLFLPNILILMNEQDL